MTDLEIIKTDLYRILAAITPEEVAHMLDNVRGGRVNGASYYADFKGECGCLIGESIAIPRGLTDQDFLNDKESRLMCHQWLTQKLGFSVNPDNPIELYIGRVVEGDTPASSNILANVERWIVAWQSRQVQS